MLYQWLLTQDKLQLSTQVRNLRNRDAKRQRELLLSAHGRSSPSHGRHSAPAPRAVALHGGGLLVLVAQAEEMATRKLREIETGGGNDTSSRRELEMQFQRVSSKLNALL